MMAFPSAYDLKEYYLTPQGASVVSLIERRFGAWASSAAIKDDVMVGAGYALPYLDLGSLRHPRKTFALMSGQMGWVAWPPESISGNGTQRCAVSDRGVWPLPAASIDTVLMIHELEYAEDPSHVLEEAWRVLKPEGRLMLVVPNRTGFWARAEKTPFGHGRPFTQTQLHDLLRDCNFAQERMAGALLAPPFSHRLFAEKVAPAIEYLAPVCGALCGVIVVEASKRLYSPIRGKSRPVPAKAAVWGASVPQGNLGA